MPPEHNSSESVSSSEVNPLRPTAKALPARNINGPQEAFQPSSVREQPYPWPELTATHNTIESSRPNVLGAVPLSIEVGRAVLSTEEAHDVQQHTVIMLDCAVNEPLDVFCHSEKIGRGHIVVVAGKIGIRMQSVSDTFQPNSDASVPARESPR